MDNTPTRPRLVVIGGGFAGLNLIRGIDKSRWGVTLIDRNNYNSFPPLFYQVASAGLDAGSISFALRGEMRSRRCRGVRFRLGEVSEIDTRVRTVTTQFETIPYDTLVIAAGTTNNFFGNNALRDRVYTMKSVTEAIRCRNDILERLERAALIADAAERRRLLSFTIVGGGPTGVEVAGALGEMKRYILRREYPSISPDDVTVTIVEGTDRLLGAMSDQAGREAVTYLESLMVNVRLGRIMKSYEDNTVTLDDGTTLHSGVVIWTAGITGEPMTFTGDIPERGPGNRFVVDEYNAVVGLQDVYALGDIAIHTDNRWPRGLPQLAQVAIQGARALAYNLNNPGHRRPFSYRDKGTMATVGRNRAVADLRHVHLHGRPAWLAWMFIHLVSLLGMRNRLTVLITWIWSYFTYSSSLRLILRPTRYPLRDPLRRRDIVN